MEPAGAVQARAPFLGAERLHKVGGASYTQRLRERCSVPSTLHAVADPHHAGQVVPRSRILYLPVPSDGNRKRQAMPASAIETDATPVARHRRDRFPPQAKNEVDVLGQSEGRVE